MLSGSKFLITALLCAVFGNVIKVFLPILFSSKNFGFDLRLKEKEQTHYTKISDINCVRSCFNIRSNQKSRQGLEMLNRIHEYLPTVKKKYKYIKPYLREWINSWKYILTHSRDIKNIWQLPNKINYLNTGCQLAILCSG